MAILPYHRQFRTVCTSPHVRKSFTKWYRHLWQPKNNEPPYDHVVQLGDPILRQQAQPVPADELRSPEVKFLAQHISTVMRKYGCVGLAAPQIGISLRAFAMEFKSKVQEEYTEAEYRMREMQTMPLTIFLNPELKVLNYEKMLFPEACESMRGYRADVPRYREVLLTGYDENGQPKELKLSGWNARIAQHEMDHLNGIVYTDIMDRKSLCCTCWQAVNANHGRIQLSFASK